MSRKSRRLAFAKSNPPTGAPAATLEQDSLLEKSSNAKLLRWLPYIGIFLLSVIFLSPALRGVYIWDDSDWLIANPVVLESGLYHLIWTDPKATPQYYPLVFTTFWLEYRIWGLGTVGPDGIHRGVGYHAVNILLHTASALLIFQILKRMKLPGGILGDFLSAAIFAIHPVNVESVAWVVERKNCLCGVFFFSALLFGLRFFHVTRYPERHDIYRWRYYALALILFVAALLSKTIACILPPVLLLLIWWRRGKISLREILLSLPFFAIAIAFGVHTAMLEVSQTGTVGPEWHFSILQRTLIAGSALWFYIGKLFVPYPVMQIYPRFAIVAGHPVTNVIYYLAPIAFLALVITLFLLRKKISRGPVTAILFFAGVAAPALGFVDFYTMILTFVADHYQYLACIGIIVLGVETILWLLRRVSEQAKAQGAQSAAEARARFYRLTSGLVAGGILLALGTLTYPAADLYSDGEALWTFNVNYNPKGFMPYLNLASVKLDKKPQDVKGAVEVLTAAINVAPQDWRAYHHLGILYLDINQPQKGLELLTKAESLMPEIVRKTRADFFAARAQGRGGNKKGGLAQRVSGTFGKHFLVARRYQENKQWDKALAEYQLDYAEYPENLETIFGIGNCYAAMADADQAVVWFKKAIARQPDYAEAWFSMGRALMAQGKREEGEKALLKARSIDDNVILKYPELSQEVANKLRNAPPPPNPPPPR